VRREEKPLPAQNLGRDLSEDAVHWDLAGGLFTAPMARVRVLKQVHRRGDSGSPGAVGSTSASRSRSSVG
jgi:hypothetical protein